MKIIDSDNDCRDCLYNSTDRSILVNLSDRITTLERDIAQIKNAIWGNGRLGMKTMLYILIAVSGFSAATIPAQLIAKLIIPHM